MSDMICQCCRRDREAQGIKPRVLVTLPKGGMQKDIKVYACEHCDGPVVELATREAS